MEYVKEDNMTKQKHKLTIHSLRDIQVSCPCGWHLSATTSDCESDKELKDRIKSQYRRHLK